MDIIFKIIAAIGLISLAVFVGIIFSFLIASPVMWLWNYVMPGLFHLPVISYWQSWALLMLSTLLFRPTLSEKK